MSAVFCVTFSFPFSTFPSESERKTQFRVALVVCSPLPAAVLMFLKLKLNEIDFLVLVLVYFDKIAHFEKPGFCFLVNEALRGFKR